MKRVGAGLLAVMLSVSLMPVFPASAQTPAEGEFDSIGSAVSRDPGTSTLNGEAGSNGVGENPSRIIVGFDKARGGGTSLYSASSTMSLLSAEGLVVDRQIAPATDQAGALSVVTIADGKSVSDAVAAAKRVPGVAFAQPDFQYGLFDDAAAAPSSSQLSPLASTNDPALVDDSAAARNQYYLYQTNTVDAWDDAQANGTVSVAVIDTGVNLSHEDLSANLRTDLAYDAYHEQALTPSGSFNGDIQGHGTHVAGIMAAAANNATGIAGASYNAQVIPVKASNDDAERSTFSTSDLVVAYRYLLGLVDAGKVDNLHVVNMSLGGYGEPGAEDVALQTYIGIARDTYRILTVCAGGNGDDDGNPLTDPSYPADFDECLSVTALEPDGTNAYWSDYNEYKDISAPGVDIYSTYYEGNNSYVKMSGTSMASPLVAGIASLCWALDPAATPDQVVEAIEASARPISDEANDRTQTSGSHGAIDAQAMLDALIGVYIQPLSAPLFRGDSVQLALGSHGVQLDPDAPVSWSVQDGSEVVSVTDAGVLTALQAGSATVVARTVATDANGEQRTVDARLAVVVKDVSLDAAPQASTDGFDGVSLSWNPVSRAVGYRVLRAEDGSDHFEEVASVQGVDSHGYVDKTAAPYCLYRYAVAPVIVVAGSDVSGAVSDSAVGVRQQEAVSLEGVPQALSRMRVSSYLTHSPIRTAVLVPQGDITVALVGAGLAGSTQGVVTPTDTQSLSSDAASVLATVKPDAVYVVGATGSFGGSIYRDIARYAPQAQVQQFEGDSSAEVSRAVLNAGQDVGRWNRSSKAVVVSGAAGSTDALAAGAYAYAAQAPVVVTDDAGDVDDSLLMGIASNTSGAVLVGGVDEIASSVESDIVDWLPHAQVSRIDASSASDASMRLAQLGLSDGTFTSDSLVFASPQAANCIEAQSLAGFLRTPLLLVDGEGSSVLDEVLQSWSKGPGIVTRAYYDGAFPLTAQQKERIAQRIEEASRPDVNPVKATVTRLAGRESYDTAAAISRSAFPDGADAVVLARCDDFADAMSATGFAGAVNAPVLLTDPRTLSEAAAEEIDRLGAQKVYVAGGPDALSSVVDEQLGARGVAVERVYGSEACDTSVAFARLLAQVQPGNCRKVVVATGSSFEDALSASSYAYRYRTPVFLQAAGATASVRSLPDSALSLLTGDGSYAQASVLAPGGPDAMSTASVEGALGTDRVTRVYGRTAYDTSNALAEYLTTHGDTEGTSYLNASCAVIASGTAALRGSDALAGASLAGINGGVVLLANGNADLGDVDYTVVDRYLSDHHGDVRAAYVLGGQTAAPASLEERIKGVLS